MNPSNPKPLPPPSPFKPSRKRNAQAWALLEMKVKDKLDLWDWLQRPEEYVL